MLIACRVAPSERDGWTMAREEMRDALFRASNRAWPIRVSFVDAPDGAGEEKPLVAVLSLLRELEARQPLADVARRLRDEVRTLSDAGVKVFLCSIFRACEDPDKLETIRRLNLMLVEISQETGAFVIDFDGAFAHIGARPLETDYRREGLNAAKLASRAIADAMLAVGFDDAIPADVLERAQRYLNADSAKAQ